MKTTDAIWVLKAAVASQRQHRPLYFAKMTGIGPMTTPILSEAARFASADEARQSPAFVFPWEFFNPECVSSVAKRKNQHSEGPK